MQKEKNKDIPIWHKVNLTIDEAAIYSHIGKNKLTEMLKRPTCPFVFVVGKGKRLIKRKEFEEWISINRGIF